MDERAFIGIGSNLGNKEENILRALYLLTAGGRVDLWAVAPFYKTDPVGYSDQDWFLNTVAEIETDLSPRGLLEVLMSIENEMGRVRTVRWGPRVIDLDILLYGNEIVNQRDLEIPHPRLEERAFVIVPLADLYPDRVLPGGFKAKEVAARLQKNQQIELYFSNDIFQE